MLRPDEYTDYSCSTSIERLARDVETKLRSWHLQGSDRHVSFGENFAPPSNDDDQDDDDIQKMISPPTSPTPSRRTSLRVPPSPGVDQDNVLLTSGDEEALRARHLIESMSSILDDSIHSTSGDSVFSMGTEASESMGTTTTPRRRRRKSRRRSSHHNTKEDATQVQLIRSETIAWTPSWSNQSILLVLALWDGPSDFSSLHQHLPQPLRRCPFRHMPSSLFDNFSQLFGIGQHVTLSLVDCGKSMSEKDTGWIGLGCAVLERHNLQLAPYILQHWLSTLLQTALNVAVANCQTHLPVLAWWGTYHPSSSLLKTSAQYESWLPPWMATSRRECQALLTAARSAQRRRGQRLSSLFRNNASRPWKNQSFLSPLLSAKVLLPADKDEIDGDAYCVVSVLPLQSFGGSLKNHGESRLTVWGQLLLRHCPPSCMSVALVGARHCYIWSKSQNSKKEKILEWRRLTPEGGVESEVPTLDDSFEVEEYRKQCRRYGLSLLEGAVGATPSEPLWGAVDDPLARVHCTATWLGKPREEEPDRDDDGEDNGSIGVEPLLMLPLRIRSQQNMTRQDWIDMEDSVEQTLLDPLVPSCKFQVRVQWDRDTSVTSLAANQRCVLAALVRSATLPLEILLRQLTSEAGLDEWSFDEAEDAATELCRQANVGSLTRRLVEAMDWTSVGDQLIETWEAEQVVKEVLGGTGSLGFPPPPEKVFSPPNDKDDTAAAAYKDVFSPLLKSAPPGRLLSMLFLCMSRLRAPSSMALVWITFVRELRSRWDVRESLPNMNYVPGLDPPPDALKAKHCISTIGLKANYSFFVYSSEPDPDDTYCLIGQKLQVFNVGVECIVAQDMYEAERMKKIQQDALSSVMFDQSDKEGDAIGGYTASVASTEIVNNVTGHPTSTDSRASFDEEEHSNREFEEPVRGSGEPVRKKPAHFATPPPFEAIDEGADERSHASGSTRNEFFDALDEENSSIECMGTEHATNVTQRQKRLGARCPVQDANLVASGDQLYAPYLQRPFPLTDDVILERRIMLARGRGDGKKSRSIKIDEQIEISQRLQKPKLLGDMQAFKAANPGAVFQDFVGWYGNPGNPLEDYSEEVDFVSRQPGESSIRDSTAMKLDKASQAMKVLTATRDFWSDTWDEASPCAAIEQQPLFDASSTVEMVLDNFETMHPASLLNQIMAVNLSSSYFVLASAAGDALKVGVVRAALFRLRERTDLALQLLSRDASVGAVSTINEIQNQGAQRLPKHASLESIRACEGACDALSTAEAAIGRATTLLQKFPQQYEVVNNILRRPDNDPSSLRDLQGRSGILGAINRQQDHHEEALPAPSLREYALRNLDDNSPCQLCVRFGDKGAMPGSDSEGGVLVALTHCDK